MAFNNVGGVVTLAAGAQTGWTFSFNGGDRGAQTAWPDVKPSGNGPAHIAFNHSKRKNGNGFTEYGVVIRNVGGEPGTHNLQGGGFS
ncbi:hypothetical protein ACMA1D_14355 [Streptomyces sp. 796.1]|uniref:hypothetical protein n=1 Tax=Streptomyces sp. 796.1 TaxID=3163029 RepID=UPI0039C9A665